MAKMTYREAEQIINARIEKAEQTGGYHWKRSDGSQWTNHNGQIVPYNPAEHGNRPAHKHSSVIGDLHDSARASMDHAGRSMFEDEEENHANANNHSGMATYAHRALQQAGVDEGLLHDIAAHGRDEGLKAAREHYKKRGTK